VLKKVKIAIVEDEMIIASVIQDCLQKLNYEVVNPVMSYNEAIEMLFTEQPDLVIIDIRISGSKDGIELAQYIRENYSIPFIYLTANSDKETLSRAKKTTPNAYLLKPFTQNDLYAAIEIGLNNFEMQKNNNALAPTSIIVKDGYDLINITFSEIVFLISADNYVKIFLKNGKSVLTRSTISEMTKRLPQNLFCQISRSCIINITLITKIEKNNVMINELILPTSSSYRPKLIAQIHK
jgi:DNA-binding LytR/AlgR family response regulator